MNKHNDMTETLARNFAKMDAVKREFHNDNCDTRTNGSNLFWRGVGALLIFGGGGYLIATVFNHVDRWLH